jgi:hypothetical protein
MVQEQPQRRGEGSQDRGKEGDGVSSSLSLLLSDFRIHQKAKTISEDDGKSHEGGGDEEDSLDQRIIEGIDRLGQKGSHAIDREEILNDKSSAKGGAYAHAHYIDEGSGDVWKDVMILDGMAGETSGFRIENILFF